MKCSVITVCFNAAETIAATIDSVLHQDLCDFEYLIIDGASTDATPAIVASYRDQRITWRSGKDGGVYFAMNKGLAQATGEIIAIINADDTFAHRSVLSKVASYMEVSDADSCYGDLEYVDRVRTDKVLRRWISGVYNIENFRFGWMPPHPAFFLKRELYLEYGSFETILRTSADYELMLRMLYKKGVSTVYLPEVLVQMKAGGQSNVSLNNRLRANAEDRKAWRLNGLNGGFLASFLKPLRKLKQFRTR